jgi:hypothetical protein
MVTPTDNPRQDLHDCIFGLHAALDRLEEDGTLERMDYLLAGAAGLFESGVARFEQLRHCLTMYGRPTPPPPIPVTSERARRDMT